MRERLVSKSPRNGATTTSAYAPIRTDPKPLEPIGVTERRQSRRRRQ